MLALYCHRRCLPRTGYIHSSSLRFQRLIDRVGSKWLDRLLLITFDISLIDICVRIINFSYNSFMILYYAVTLFHCIYLLILIFLNNISIFSFLFHLIFINFFQIYVISTKNYHDRLTSTEDVCTKFDTQAFLRAIILAYWRRMPW